MKKYSKGKLKFKRVIIPLLIIFVVLLVIGSVILFAFGLRKNITKVYEESGAKDVSDDVAQNSTPIILNNLVIGATYENRWVSSTKYYLKSINKNDYELYMYIKGSRAGIYKITDLYTDSDNSVYADTTYTNYIDEYFGVSKDNTTALDYTFSEEEANEKDYEYVKRALGVYRIYNNTINIRNVYSGYINENTPVKIIDVTSNNKGPFDGIYSAVIVAFPNENKSKIIEYSYTNDEKNDDFPIYSTKFLADLNGDNNGDIIIMAVKEFNVTYSVFEYDGSKFVKVLSETIKSN